MGEVKREIKITCDSERGGLREEGEAIAAAESALVEPLVRLLRGLVNDLKGKKRLIVCLRKLRPRPPENGP